MRRQVDFVEVAECGTAVGSEVVMRAWLLDLVSEKLLGEFSEENPCEKGHKDRQRRCPGCELGSSELRSMAGPEMLLGVGLQGRLIYLQVKQFWLC